MAALSLLFTMLHLVNTSVTSLCKKTLLPWTILRVEEQDHTVSDFFTRNVMPRLSHGSRSHCAISSAHVGRDKASLDLVDVSLPLVAVVTSFGPFLKYTVSLNDVTETGTIELDESTISTM